MSELFELMRSLIDVVLHIDQHLSAWSAWLGPWLYVIVFLIIFAETGLVIAPFLPGDSLLFALGALTTLDQNPLSLTTLMVSLMIAAIIGDRTNYFFGELIGPKVFNREDSFFFHKSHLEKAQSFYVKYGPKAIVIARFAPIVRTMVPFVAGVGRMDKKRFFTYNVLGSILWVNSFLLAGHFFGNLPIVQKNFHIVIFGVIGLSLLPIVYELVKARLDAKKAA